MRGSSVSKHADTAKLQLQKLRRRSIDMTDEGTKELLSTMPINIKPNTTIGRLSGVSLAASSAGTSPRSSFTLSKSKTMALRACMDLWDHELVGDSKDLKEATRRLIIQKISKLKQGNVLSFPK